MEEQGRIIGIDLGTTHSLVSFIKGDSPRIVPNERGDRMTPSVVHFREDGEIIVGEMAKSQAVLNADRTVSNVKRAMGCPDTVFDIGGQSYRPPDISGSILKKLKTCAETYLGETITDAVITVPAYFNDRQRQDTVAAAGLAGLRVRYLLNEPTAAALAFGLSESADQRLMVLDLGGGTFDITLMEYTGKAFRVRGVGGSTTLGGINFDQAIIDHILGFFADVHRIDLSADRIAYQQLVIHAEKAKKDLSSAQETQILIPYITVTEKGPIHLNMTLTRETFEHLVAGLLSEIRERTLSTFRNSGLSLDWVDTVIFVGGSTRIPALEQLLTDLLTSGEPDKADGPGRQRPFTIKRNINPDEAVARGAGILAGILSKDLPEVNFYDITPHDLGVADDASRFVPLLPRGTTYPTEASQLFTTMADHQNAVEVHVLQRIGAAPDAASDLVSLGWFRLPVNPGYKKGEPNIDVTFSIDRNGMLLVTAVDIDSGEHNTLTITPDSVFTQARVTEPIEKGATVVALKRHPHQQKRRR